MLLTLSLGQVRGTLEAGVEAQLVEELRRLPARLGEALAMDSIVEKVAELFADKHHTLFLGRGAQFPVAMEGALKLKEISYIHAEAYAAGELKHGTLALIIEGVPVIALATQMDVYEKTLSNIKEVKARDAVVIGLAMEGDDQIKKYVDHTIFIPATEKYLAPILAVIPLQLLAYYAAVTRGCDVDKPRNLAKSVTVE